MVLNDEPNTVADSQPDSTSEQQAPAITTPETSINSSQTLTIENRVTVSPRTVVQETRRSERRTSHRSRFPNNNHRNRSEHPRWQASTYRPRYDDDNLPLHMRSRNRFEYPHWRDRSRPRSPRQESFHHHQSELRDDYLRDRNFRGQDIAERPASNPYIS